MSDEADRGSKGASPTGLAFADEIEIRVEKIVTGGDGLGRWHGIPIFVSCSLPGDRLLVRVTERRPDYGRAEIVRILEPGEGRREPPCPHFGVCGGCDLQHIEDDLQTRLRAHSVEETLARIGGIESREPLRVVSGDAWGYRQRTQVHVEMVDGSPSVGYRARGTRQLVPVRECPILAPELEELLSVLPGALTGESPRRLDLLVGEGGRLTVSPRVAGLPHGEVEIYAGETTFALDARSFFQAHRGLLTELIDLVVGEWSGNEAFDLFAGIGFFALPLARRYTKVVGVEGDRIAVRFLERNARRNRLPSLASAHSAVETWIDQLPERPDRVVVDPPRVGLTAGVRDTLRRRRPRRLTYVSCHPATLARDLRAMQRDFEVETITLVDLFPQTGHMEVVVQLVS